MQDRCVRDSVLPLSDLEKAREDARGRLCRAMAALGWGDRHVARYVRRSLQTVWRWRHGLVQDIPAACLELVWTRAGLSQAGAV